MDDTRGRRPRGKKKVRFEEVLPSTDLPPLVQGDLRCFLIVDIGKILWSSTATAQVPPASPAYVRLRWWGETSDGTLFKPYCGRNERPVKCRCRFGIRSGSKQMTAYFVDMGSIVCEVLTSPKSVPLGRIQIPKAAHLSSSNPIRDFFPIYSPSSRKIGELEIHIRFKSLEGAYDITTDTGTDTSMSSRSRAASEIGRRSRSRGSSAGSASNRGSARSRSSSVGSRKSGKKKKPTSKSKGRRRSRSSESNASSASKKSHSNKKASTIDSSTPRGIDELLQQNGHDLYALESKSRKKSSTKSGEREEEEVIKQDERPSSLQQDAISVLLHRGNQLRDDILKCQFETNLPKSSVAYAETKSKTPLFEATTNQQAPLNSLPEEQPPSIPAVLKQPKLVTPIKEKRQDLDMRFVDLVFGSQEFKGNPAYLSALDSHSMSPISSMVSEFEDNPLFDESLLQQMFYNNTHLHNVHKMNGQLHAPENGKDRQAAGYSNAEALPPKNFSPFEKGDRSLQNLAKHIPGMSVQRLLDLQRVNRIAVTVETLALNQLDISMSKTKLKKGSGIGGKPPVPSPKGKQKTGVYFVEYHLPKPTSWQREHPSSMKTSHDVTRVASRKSNVTGGHVIVFDECSEFQFHFTEENLMKWAKEVMEFSIYHRKPNERKANQIGSTSIELRNLLIANHMEFSVDASVTKNREIAGNLKITMEFIAPSTPEEDSNSMDDDAKTTPEVVENEIQKPAQMEVTNCVQDNGSTIALSPLTSILHMMLMVQEGFNIPGTTVISPREGMVAHPPNVSLVCRALTSGESQKTPIIWGKTNPKFDFVQITPLKLNNSLLSRMKNNFVIIEVWTRIASTDPHSDKLLGLAKLPTHHFYQSLKDDEISRVVLNSLHPLISVDELVPVVDLFTGEQRGQLNATLAIGTQTQISTLRKTKLEIQGKRAQKHHLDDKKFAASNQETSGPVQHMFEICIVKLNGFKPQNNQVWGETDCFVQYKFPTQKSSDENLDLGENEDSESLKLASMEDYRSEATLCIPNPVFNDSRCHNFNPPPSVPVQRILLSCCYGDKIEGGIPFELWSRFYHPNTRDQLLAKGTLPAAKLGALVSMTSSKTSEQTFHIPLEFVEAENDQTAGKLEVRIKYHVSGTTMESIQPPMKFTKPVILRIGLIRACGLKAAAVLACRHSNNEDLKYCSDVGVNTYVEMKPSFLPDEETRMSRVVAQSFAPEFQHYIELACPLISYHRDITPVSLAELLISGEMEITVWHRAEDGVVNQSKDILLGTLTIPMRSLLHKTNGVHSWHPLKALQSGQSSPDGSVIVGGMEMSMSFTGTNDLDLILKAAKATGWSLPPFESRLLNDNTINPDINGNDRVTFSVTVTNAWLPKHEVLLHGRTAIDKNANVYIRYKFFDHDSVTSSLCSLVSKQPHSIDARFENLTSARIAHKKSFVCKKSRPLNWYLREERLELQLWLTHSAATKKSRPLDSDKLLGSCYIDLSMISDLEKEQHISGSFNIFKAGAEDLSRGHARVYISVKPGDIVDPIPDPLPAEVHSQDEDSIVLEPEDPSPKSSGNLSNESAFTAVVTVEQGMHLPLVSNLETEELMEPNSFVSYEVVDSTIVPADLEDLKLVTVVTKIAVGTQSPTWKDAKEIALPRHLLTGMHGALLLKVWHRDQLYLSTNDATNRPSQDVGIELMATDRMLGFATVDLSVLRAGLRDVNGWYNILDIHGQCQGQMKVAVTPTTPDISQPSSARSYESSQRSSTYSAQKVTKFLHQTPIDVPVQTPSGSMYFPGLQNSIQTAKMVGNEEVSHMHKVQENEERSMQLLSDDIRSKLQIGGPAPSSTSMFRYVTSDRQQACLVNTLEKQMQELEGIKKKFEERRAGGFGGHTTENHSQRPPTIQSDALSEQHNTLNGQNPLVSEGTHMEGWHTISDTKLDGDNRQKDRTGNGLGETRVTNLEPTTNDENCTPSASGHPLQPERPKIGGNFNPISTTQPKSVHLSLYEYEKNADFNDRPMSDNEANLGFEFVQPRSLNESLCSDFSEKIPGNILKKPPHAEQRNHKHDPTTLTPGPSEGHSALEDTSLWLTGSSLRVSGCSSDEEHSAPRSRPKPKIPEVPLIPDDHSSSEVVDHQSPSSEDERSITPLEEDIHDQLHPRPESSNADVDVEDADEEQASDASDAMEEDDLPESPKVNGQAVSQVGSPEELCPHTPVDQEESNNFELTTERKELLDQHEAEDVSKTTESSMSDEDDPDKVPSLIVDPVQKSSDTESSRESDQSSLVEDAETHSCEPPEALAPTLEPPQPSSAPHKENRCFGDSFNDENLCPNLVPPPHKKVTKPKRSLTGFFPPSQDLEASMRALQQATLKHKSDLLKRKEATSNAEDDSFIKATDSTSHRPKKLPQKPIDYPDEKTRRLAKIFRTKFSS